MGGVNERTIGNWTWREAAGEKQILAWRRGFWCNDGHMVTEKVVTYLLVGLGSALGGMGRFWISVAMVERFGARFPWGTLVVNVTGSFAIGIFAGLAGTQLKAPARSSYFLTAGVCGGYTTFSAFSLQTLSLLREGNWAWAGANVALSLVLCLLGTWAGFGLGALIRR